MYKDGICHSINWSKQCFRDTGDDVLIILALVLLLTVLRRAVAPGSKYSGQRRQGPAFWGREAMFLYTGGNVSTRLWQARGPGQVKTLIPGRKQCTILCSECRNDWWCGKVTRQYESTMRVADCL
jgi:hypothetical protein